MPFVRSAFYRQQCAGAMATGFETSLRLAADALENLPAVVAPTQQNSADNLDPRVLKVNPARAVRIMVQSADMNQPQPRPIAAKKIGQGPWLLFYTNHATMQGYKEILMIGTYTDNGVLKDWFNWPMDGGQRSVLNGTWTPPQGADNTVNMNHQGALIYDHNNKHFGHQPAESQYTIGTAQTRKTIVAGMEAKALQWGNFLETECFFRFNVTVGTDGQAPQQQTCSIRVDTPGGPSQHSHPIPENATGKVSHDTKIRSAIRFFTTERKLDNLVMLAKYLRVIGCANNAYNNLRNDAAAYGEARPPACVYWSW